MGKTSEGNERFVLLNGKDIETCQNVHGVSLVSKCNDIPIDMSSDGKVKWIEITLWIIYGQ